MTWLIKGLCLPTGLAFNRHGCLGRWAHSGGEALTSNLNATASAEGAATSASVEWTCLIAIASQAWRLSRLTRRALEKLPEADGTRLASQVRYIDRQIEDERRRENRYHWWSAMR